MILSPFDIPEPLFIGMSGGRTSAYQLWRFLQNFGGELPGKRVVGFANTGDEDERTLRFVKRVGDEWGVKIHWLEYRFVPFPDWLLNNEKFRTLRRRQFENRSDKAMREEVACWMESAEFPEQAESIRKGRECLNGKANYTEVAFATASRNKEPYSTLLNALRDYRAYVKGLPGVVPNPAQRLCTGFLKVKVIHKFVYDLWGCKKDEYNVALALRADEVHRINNALGSDLEAGVPHFPLCDAGIRSSDVLAFWAQQPFDLGMKTFEGNCRNCFMKRREALLTLIRRNPSSADWWIAREEEAQDRFRRDRPSYKAMKWEAEHQPLLFPEPVDMEIGQECDSGYCSD